MKHLAFSYLGRGAKCPQCGTDDLKQRSTVDRIDRLKRTPIGLLQGLLGANLHHCLSCRLQFYDFRSCTSHGAEERGTTATPVV